MPAPTSTLRQSVRRISVLVLIAACPDAGEAQFVDWQLIAEYEALSAPDTDLLEAIRYGRIEDSGSAVVVDVGGPAVIRFGSGGRDLLVASRGSGPGELESVDGFEMGADGELVIWDARLHRLSAFAADGSVLWMANVPGAFEPLLGRFANGDVLLASLSFGRRHGPGVLTPERWELSRFRADGTHVGSVGTAQGMWRTARAPAPFSPVPQILVHSDSMYIAHPFEPLVTVRDVGGRARRRIVLRELPLPPSERDSRAALRLELRDRDSDFFLTLLRDAPELGRMPVIGAMKIDRTRREIWVKPYDPASDAVWLKRDALQIGPGGTWHVYTLTGIPRGRMILPADLALLDVNGDRLLALARDHMDVEQVRMYEIHRP